MLNAVRAPVVLLAVLAALGLAACGGTVIDESKAEDQVKANIEHNTNRTVTSVHCPSGVDVKAGTVFKCDVVAANGDQATALLKILNSDADTEFVVLKAKK
jgi:hypothetical protein